MDQISYAKTRGLKAPQVASDHEASVSSRDSTGGVVFDLTHRNASKAEDLAA